MDQTEKSLNGKSPQSNGTIVDLGVRFKAGLQSVLANGMSLVSRQSASPAAQPAQREPADALKSSSLDPSDDVDLLDDDDDNSQRGGDENLDDNEEDALLDGEPASKKPKLGDGSEESRAKEPSAKSDVPQKPIDTASSVTAPAGPTSADRTLGSSGAASTSESPAASATTTSQTAAATSNTVSVTTASSKMASATTTTTARAVTTSKADSPSSAAGKKTSSVVSQILKSISEAGKPEQDNQPSSHSVTSTVPAAPKSPPAQPAKSPSDADQQTSKSNSATVSRSSDSPAPPAPVAETAQDTSPALTSTSDPVTGVCTQRASPHVSPSNSDNESSDLPLNNGNTTTEEMSEEEDDDGNSRDSQPSGRYTSHNRLHKLICRLSGKADDEGTSSSVSRSRAPSSGGSGGAASGDVALGKKVLASFYENVLRTKVLQQTYFDQISKREAELGFKCHADSRKISKILQEVKVIRSKLKELHARPSQRSVGTQISTMLAPQAPLSAVHNELNGLKTIKSRLPSANDSKTDDKAFKYVVPIATLKPHTPVLLASAAPSVTPVRAAASPKTAAGAGQNGASVTTATAAKAATTPPRVTNEVIDLTGDDKAAAVERAPVPIRPKPSVTSSTTSSSQVTVVPSSTSGSARTPLKPEQQSASRLHPAPLPPCPLTGKTGILMKPPPPTLVISAKHDGIQLQWDLLLSNQHSKVASYQIFGYKERPGPLVGTEWKKVGDLKALPLPMACTLTQFQTGYTYHFAVRAVDELSRTGPFSLPRSIRLPPVK